MSLRHPSRNAKYSGMVLLAFLIVPAAWILISRGAEGQQALEPAQAERPLVGEAPLMAQIRREMAIQEKRHEQRLADLNLLAAKLKTNQDPDFARVQQMIQEENRDYNARLRSLQNLAQLQDGETIHSVEERELRELAQAIGRLNQSYAYAPIVSSTAAVGGSFYIDRDDNARPRYRDPRIGENIPRPPGQQTADTEAAEIQKLRELVEQLSQKVAALEDKMNPTPPPPPVAQSTAKE